jgi:K+-sensing histidine kinase KdpD
MYAKLTKLLRVCIATMALSSLVLYSVRNAGMAALFLWPIVTVLFYASVLAAVLTIISLPIYMIVFFRQNKTLNMNHQTEFWAYILLSFVALVVLILTFDKSIPR